MLKRKGQRITVACGLAIFLFMGFYPPWREVLNYGQGLRIAESVSYSFIVDPPEPKNTSRPYYVEIDWSRLLIGWICVMVLTVGIVLLIGSGSKKPNPPGFR